MLSAKSVVASSLLAFGHFSRGVAAQCVGESNGVTYDFCGAIGPVNVYWTNVEGGVDGPQTNILFERVDDGWTAFGFTNQDPPNAMVGTNHIFGCDSFLEPVVANTPSPYDGYISERSPQGVIGGLLENQLSRPGTITVSRMDGVCGIRFERLQILGPDAQQLNGAQNILAGIQNRIVYAFGEADVIGAHAQDARGFGLQDFLGNTGVLTDNPVVPLALDNGPCVGETNGVTYDFCGRFGETNVYWSNGVDQTTILVESSDNEYTSFGFTGNAADSGQAMIGANHIVGCHDWDDIDSPSAGVITERSGEGVVGNLVTPGQDALVVPNSVTEIRQNGICGIEFSRPLVLPPPVEQIINAGPIENQNLRPGLPNVVVWARGNQAAPAAHDQVSRGAANQDFLNGLGGITATPVQPFGNGGGNPALGADNSSASLSVSLSMIATAVAAALRFW